MLTLILSIITVALTTLLAIFMNSAFSFNITAFSVFFIVPVGAILIGALACWGYFAGLLKSNKKLTSRLKWLGVLLAFVTFAAVQFGYYLTAYIDDNGDLNYNMEGEHISNYCFKDSDEPINFFTFTKENVDTMTISFTNHGSELFKVAENSTVNWIFYVIDILGAMAGCFVVKGMVIGSKKYCDECKRYMKQKNLIKFSTANQTILEKIRGINTLSHEEIKGLLSVGNQYPGEHYAVHMDWCTECFSGYLQLKFMEHQGKNKFKHIPAKSIEVKLSSSVVTMCLK